MGTRHSVNLPKGMLAGVLGGLAATWAMSESQAWWSRAVDGTEPRSAAGRHDARDWQERTEGQNANELAAEAVGETVLGRPLRRSELAAGAAAMHYSFGSAAGALYGALAEVSPQITSGMGTGYGTLVWAGADEFGMPALNLAGPSSQRPAEAHAQSLAAHLVYGLTLEVVRRAVRRLL
jgi:putative membrane protein